MTTCKDFLCAFLAIIFALAVGFTMDIASEKNMLAKKSWLIGATRTDQPAAIFSNAKPLGASDLLCRKA